MNENSTAVPQQRSAAMFALSAAATAGRSVYDNVKTYPKVVSPQSLSQPSSSGAFNSHSLVDAVNKLVDSPSFNVPAAGIMGILGTRTVANQGFAA